MSVITYLDGRASGAILSSIEETSINTSIATIRTRLTNHFTAGLADQFRFGSSTRGTILPRSMDEHSDIDYMIVFSDGSYTPQTYLDRLRRFAETYYYSSDIKQSSPSLVLQLNHIKFDLVPALKQAYSGYKIPSGPNAWQDTNPNDFNASLTAKNNTELYKIKPAIRLTKFWNARNGYIYDAYGLERYVVGQSFPTAISIRDYLFTIFDGLSLGYEQPQWRKDKLNRAKDIISNVRRLERDGISITAESEIKKLIPEQ